MTGSSDRLHVIHGSDAPIPQMRTLRAGPVTMLLDGIDLRYLKIGSTELVRRVYSAVRDVDWNTLPATVTGHEVRETDGGFVVVFQAHHTGREIDFSWRGTITGDETGRVEFTFDGRAEELCRHNRIGICVHHPWRETAGAPFTARTPDGELSGSFPDLIGPQALVDDSLRPLFAPFDRLELDLPTGGKILFEFEGDLWEVEDHRNWTDANFKTYSTPVTLGRPAPLEAGQGLRQRLVITPVDVPVAAPSDGPVQLSVGAPTGTRVPLIGLGQDRDLHRTDPSELALLGALAPAHVRVEVRLDRDDWREALAAGQETAASIGSSLEVSLHVLEADAGRLDAVASALAEGPAVERVLVVNADSQTRTPAETTRPQLVNIVRDALGRALPGAQFVGGTEIYFAEINRSRPQLAVWDGLCYSISPQIHAFTDTDVMENLDAQSETVRSARALAGDKPVIVSPITMRRRFNFHAAGDPAPTPAGELPDEVDVRQSALYGGAWTVGSLKYLAESGVEALTYYESTGWRGVLERSSGSELPDTFRSRPGEVFPLYHPLADAIGWRGAEVLSCDSSDVLTSVALAVRVEDGSLRLLVANLTAVEQAVVVRPLEGKLSLRRLNESTASEAASDPAAFRARLDTATAAGELSLTLQPYEVVRIDPA